MNELERKARNESRLAELHPAFRLRLQAVLKELEEAGYRPRIQVGWRSPELQLKAYEEGRSKLKYGFHNVTALDGTKEALATDIYDDDFPEEPRLAFLLRLAAAARQNGLGTGIDWDLAPERVAAIDAAIKNKDWNAKVAVGWDSQHVEITGMIPAEAQAGKRPEMPSAETPEAALGSGEEEVKSKASHYRVEKVETGQIVEYEWSTAFKPVVLLPVPYVSQIGAGADAHRNDCGAASAVMLMEAYLDLKMTPDEFYTKFAIPGDVYLSVPQLRNAMGSQGLLTDFRAGLTLQDLFTFLAAGRPPIVLFRYKTLSSAGLTERPFEGPHFCPVVGMDCKYIYLHDPLYTDPAAGEAHPYPLDRFWQAWRDVALDPGLPNPERSAIIPGAGIGFRLARRVRVTSEALYVRSAPSPDKPAVGTLKKDDLVEVQREISGWGEIGTDRWINLSFTAVVQ